jgi:hypothetical protein
MIDFVNRRLDLTRIFSRALVLALVCAVAVSGCRKDEPSQAPSEEAVFSFQVYPGSRYLAQLTELTKQAHRVIKPGSEPPPTAIYDTDASLEQVAAWYAKEYGYGDVAPDVTNNLSVAKPPAYYRTGDLAVDAKGIESLIPKLKLQTDISKAKGTYRAADIEPKPNRPRVTIQRPYFDATTSQVVDRTLILMARG